MTNYSGLSATELEVFQLTAEGLIVRETAARLGRREETIKSHRKRVIHKLDARTMPHAIALGIVMGALDVKRLVEQAWGPGVSP